MEQSSCKRCKKPVEDQGKTQCNKCIEYRNKYRYENRVELAEVARVRYQQNKKKEAERHRKYNQDHAEEIKAKKQEKQQCEICKGKYTRSHSADHLKTNKHICALHPEMKPKTPKHIKDEQDYQLWLK